MKDVMMDAMPGEGRDDMKDVMMDAMAGKGC